MKFATIDDFVSDAILRMEDGDGTFDTLNITDPIAEFHQEASRSRFSEDIDESITSEMVVKLLDTARYHGRQVTRLQFGFFPIDHSITLSMVKLFQNKKHVWKQLKIQRCAGRVLEACLGIVAVKGNLEELVLIQNNLGYSGFSSVAMILASNPAKLESLHVVDFISPHSAEALSSGILANTTLRSLNMSECSFDSDAFQYIFQSIGHHPSIQKLDLSHCNLTDACAGSLLKILGAETLISHINLNFNYCSIKTMKAIAIALRDNLMKNLASISLEKQYTHLDSRLSMPLPVGMLGGPLEKNTKLTSLSLSDNRLHRAEIGLLMSGVKESRIERIMLARCGIADPELTYILSKLPGSIREIDLSDNLFASEESDRALQRAAEQYQLLENLRIDVDLMCWSQVSYLTRLNRGGIRILKSQEDVPSSLLVPLFVRINTLNWQGCSPLGPSRGYREDVIFAFLKLSQFCSQFS